ncbi:uncharacterized protein BJX67DRAFT_51784 [Aspergillus lucknowensis]|uniref:Secreted protein n=1 Tax=Aspergillus lucknowensis TaxID=176173 RepID=A0ABR4LUN7_9EURO
MQRRSCPSTSLHLPIPLAFAASGEHNLKRWTPKENAGAKGKGTNAVRTPLLVGLMLFFLRCSFLRGNPCLRLVRVANAPRHNFESPGWYRKLTKVHPSL